MRLTFFFLLIATGFANHIFAQQLAPPPTLPDDSTSYRYYPWLLLKKKLWGYSDANGKILIKPAFLEVKGFFKGFAAAKNDKGWGLINEKGKWAIQPEYDYIDCDEYVGFFRMEKKDIRVIKYVVNGQLADSLPNSDDFGVAMMMDNGDAYEVEPPPNREVRRFFHEGSKQWHLGEFLVRPGKSDTLMYSRSFPFNFSEPVNKTDDLRFSYYSNDEKKYGLLVWSKYKWIFDRTEPTYDSIWTGIYANPTFFGKKNGKVVIINFETHVNDFYESPPQFDEVKNWSAMYYVVRVGNEWFRVKDFGHYIPSLKSVKTTIDPELIIRQVDDILPGGSSAYYLYKENGLMGIVINRNADKASDDKEDWFRIPAQFTSIERRDYWFQHNTQWSAYYLFDVTLKNGTKGPMTTTGTLLFK